MAGLQLREVVPPRRRVHDANEAEFLETLAATEAQDQKAQKAQQAHLQEETQQSRQQSSGCSYLEAVLLLLPPRLLCPSCRRVGDAHLTPPPHTQREEAGSGFECCCLLGAPWIRLARL
jgi:hypothetical protein